MKHHLKKAHWRRILAHARAKPGVRKHLGKLLVRIGFDNEKRVLDAFTQNAHQFPVWLMSVRHGNRHEDEKKKADIVCETDIGPIYLQIKSSRHNAEHFLHTNHARWVACIVVDSAMSLEALYHAALHAIKIKYDEFASQRKDPRSSD